MEKTWMWQLPPELQKGWMPATDPFQMSSRHRDKGEKWGQVFFPICMAQKICCFNDCEGPNVCYTTRSMIDLLSVFLNLKLSLKGAINYMLGAIRWERSQSSLKWATLGTRALGFPMPRPCAALCILPAAGSGNCWQQPWPCFAAGLQSVQGC